MSDEQDMGASLRETGTLMNGVELHRLRPLG
jgi:hypothetical protein